MDVQSPSSLLQAHLRFWFPAHILLQPLQVESDSESEDEKQSESICPISDSIGFIGAGQMGEALIRGFVSSGVSSAGKIAASVRSIERQKAMARIGVQTFGNALEGGAAAIAKSDIIVLGVRPCIKVSGLRVQGCRWRAAKPNSVDSALSSLLELLQQCNSG